MAYIDSKWGFVDDISADARFALHVQVELKWFGD
jgi:hypothetical protein